MIVKTFKLKYRQFETELILSELQLKEPLLLGAIFKATIINLMNQEQEHHRDYMDYIKEESEYESYLERKEEKE